MNILSSLCHTWSHFHLNLRLGRVRGVQLGRRVGHGGGRGQGQGDEDVEAGQDRVEDII